MDTSQEPPGGLSASSVLARNENIVFTPLDDSIVMMDVDEGQYFELDPVAARIWTLIDEGRTMRSIRDALMEEYDVSAETCSQDLLEFVQTALQMGIVRVEAGSFTRGAGPSRTPAEGSFMRGAGPSRTPAEGSGGRV